MPDSIKTKSRIALIRHGRSAHVHAGWINATGFRAWREAYEAAGIRADERAPAHLQQLMAGVDLVLSSDAARAQATARLLAPEHKVVSSPLLRELDLESPRLGGLRLPLAAWVLAVGGRTLVLTLRGQYPSIAEATRINNAAAWLTELSEQHSMIIAVTHGSFRQQLSNRLVQTGWQSEPGRRSIQHWSAWFLRRSANQEVR